jgi:formamidopyrimidine-DNA glycosylase
MPELPEVESVRRSLTPHVLGRRIVAVDLARRDIVTGEHSPDALLVGSCMVELRRRGKQLAIIADNGRLLLVHLGMSGQLFWLAPGAGAPRADHIHARWSLATESGAPAGEIIFRDPRRFGGLWTLPDHAALEHHWRALGPDALTITPAQLAAAVATSRRAIKTLLLDQHALAGVGNIYADEALHASGIHPRYRADRLTAAQVVRLAGAIRRVLAASIRAGGSTLRDYVQGDGTRGGYASRHKVYGRAGEACRTCGEPLASAVLGQRMTVWCRSCQPLSVRPSLRSKR